MLAIKSRTTCKDGNSPQGQGKACPIVKESPQIHEVGEADGIQ